MATTTKKYKLIKEYPGSLPIDTIIELISTSTATFRVLESKSKDQAVFIKSVEKYPEFWQEVKEPLFITYDGVPIYYGDEFWCVDKDFDLWFIGTASKNAGKTVGLKYFSTKESAEKYIYENKPRYSKRDLECILRRSDGYDIFTGGDSMHQMHWVVINQTRNLIKEMLKEE